MFEKKILLLRFWGTLFYFKSSFIRKNVSIDVNNEFYNNLNSLLYIIRERCYLENVVKTVWFFQHTQDALYGRYRDRPLATFVKLASPPCPIESGPILKFNQLLITNCNRYHSICNQIVSEKT